jgi:hypothetical protein
MVHSPYDAGRSPFVADPLAMNHIYERRIKKLERELAALRARIDGAETITITFDDSGEADIDIFIEDMKPGETRTFKLVEVKT